MTEIMGSTEKEPSQMVIPDDSKSTYGKCHGESEARFAIGVPFVSVDLVESESFRYLRTREQ
jgi:hypothetical protein